MEYRYLAAVVMAVFYCAFLVKLVLAKRKGRNIYFLGNDKKDVRLYRNEIILKYVTIAVLAVQIISIIFAKVTRLYPIRFLGLVISVFGILLYLKSMKTMGDSWIIGIDTSRKYRLIFEGIYKFSRNPAYLAVYIFYFGILCMVFTWYLAVVSVLAGLVYHQQILYEEIYLSEMYGIQYIAYKDRVRRYFGRKIYNDDDK